MNKRAPYKNANPIRLAATDEVIIKAVSSSQSYAAALRYLGLTPSGANHKWIKSNIKRLKIDTKHMTGCGWTAGRTMPEASKRMRPLKEILVKNSEYTSTNSLKKRLVREGKLENICSLCGITDWGGKPLALHLDHINGINNDHRLVNLRILCPNCHSQTDTYAGRGKKDRVEPNRCMDCGTQISQESSRCKPCAGKAQRGVRKGSRANGEHEAIPRYDKCQNCYRPKRYNSGKANCKACAGMLQETKIEWPALEDLQKLVAETNYTHAGKKIGVSDNAVRKHIRNQVSLQARRKEFGYPGA